MRKSLVLVAALLTATSAMAADLSVSKSNCSVSYINKVAMNEGLAKATTLSKECIAKGYNASKSWDFMKEKGAAAKEAAGNLADKGLEKAAALKDKLFK